MQASLLHKNNDLLHPAFLINKAGKESILRALAYFDLFRYPLTKEEILKFMDQPAAEDKANEWLSELIDASAVFSHHGFYSLQDNPLIIHRRNEGQQRAAQLLIKAKKIGRFLQQFPFVRAVAVSGSLSKNFADEKADIDFFIITKANRLWLARTFMHLFKKITFLAGRQHYYCMNYYIDEQALLLEEKNIFTAIELKTLLPVAGEKSINEFFTVNQWSGEWLPCCEYRKQEQKDSRVSIFKNFFEWIFDNRIGNALDKWFFKITSRRWADKKEKGKKNQKGIMMGLITGRHFARSNPGNFQAKVLKQYEQRITELGALPV